MKTKCACGKPAGPTGLCADCFLNHDAYLSLPPLKYDANAKHCSLCGDTKVVAVIPHGWGHNDAIEDECPWCLRRSVKSFMTNFQRQILRWCERGCGVDARPSQMTKKQRREADELVAAGLLRHTKNHSADKHGMYVKT